MLKSLTSGKRPYANSLNPNEFHNHKCYFHDTHLISKFCINKKCTLPLCEKCIPIHIKQHLKESNILGQQNIVPFSSAYQNATQNLQALINTTTKNYSQMRQQLSSTKKQIEDLIKKQFSKIQQHLVKSENELKVITEKFNKIKKGSLKSLIFYFSDEKVIKHKFEPINWEQIKLAQIPVIVEKLRNTLGIFTNKPQEKLFFNSQMPKRSDSTPKTQNYPIKNYSSTFLASSSNNNNLNQLNVNPLRQQKLSQKMEVKFQSSSDFSLVLKQQRNRLQSVRNKNLSFAMNYSSENQQSSKAGSKSVDNFYFTRNKLAEDNKEQTETRPLQIASRDYNNLKKGFSPKKSDINSSSQQKLSKIKQKYIGEMSLSKENIRTQSKHTIKNESMSNSKYHKHTPIHGLNPAQSQQTKSKDLENKILSRQQIRVNIQHRLNQRSMGVLNEKQKQRGNPGILEGRQLFCDLIKHETLKQPLLKEKVEQFTLNKNYQRQSFRQQINGADKVRQSFRQQMNEADKVPMSSIKRQLRAERFDNTQNQYLAKKFFDDHSQKEANINSKDQKATIKYEAINSRQNSMNAIFDKIRTPNQEEPKTKIIQRQNFKANHSQKDLLYEEAKQSIKLNDPKTCNGQPNHPALQTRSEYESRQNSESKRKEGARRFNYLYDAGHQTSQFNVQAN